MHFSPFKLKLRAALPLLAAALFLSTPALAQPSVGHFNCGTDAYWQKKVQANPALYQQSLDMMRQVQNRPAMAKGDDTTLRIIPVVFHIIHVYGAENVSKQSILAQIKTLNDDYRCRNADSSKIRSMFKSRKADIHVEFRLAGKDPNGNCTDGIERIYSQSTFNADDRVKSLSVWDTRKYLNIWVVASINSSGTQGTILGYSQFPWDNSDNTDGVLVRADQITGGNKTLTHEIGHYLGLLHTFESAFGAECGHDCTKTGDWVCDTPPTDGPNFSFDPTHNSCTSDVPDLPDMEENYMDYSPYLYLFTQGQKDRMDDYLINSKRANLYTEANLTATGVLNNTSACAPKADFSPLSYTVCEGGSVSFRDNSYNADAMNYNWSFDGGSPAVSSTQNPSIRFDKAGEYTVSLKVSNSAGSDEITRTAVIHVLPAVSDIKTPLTESFENGDLQTKGWDFSKDARGVGWQPSANAAVTGTHSLYLSNHTATSGQVYSFTLPPVDMTTAKSTMLRFKLAYAQQSATSADEMRVYVSTSCGQGFLLVDARGGKKLASVSDYRSTFTPADASEWQNYSLDLKNYANVKNLMVRVSLLSKAGNDVYIEDINLGNTTSGIQEPTAESTALQVYPNPSAGQVSLSLAAGTATAPAILEVYDVMGRQLARITNLPVGNGAAALTFSKQDLNISGSGMYYFKLYVGDQAFIRKIAFSN